MAVRSQGRKRVGATTLQRDPVPLMSDTAAAVKKAVLPDAIAVALGLRFEDAADAAAYQILKPLFLTDLPLPWEVHRHEHGRWDFFHPGVRENRREHPMLSFFMDVLQFLRANATTTMPMAELLESQVFKEASPEVVRYRLGIWEGPLQDEAAASGLCFLRQWPGRDKAAVKVEQRSDDPRLEAAANISFRLGGWMHLWKGFVGEEPFPLLEGRLAALCLQLGESVVTAPGMATMQMIAHMEQLLPRLEPPTPPPEEVPLSAEEEALQPLVTQILAKAYSLAISAAARRETEAMMQEGRLAGDSDEFAARVTCNLIYRTSQRLVADLEHEEWVAAQFPPEEEEDRYSDDLEEDPFHEDEEEEQTEEEDVEDQGERHVQDQPAEEEEEEEVYVEDDQEDVLAFVDDPEILVEETDDVQRVIQKCKGFLASLETDHDTWAREKLRPWTPPSRRPTVAQEVKALWPESPRVATHRPRLGRKQRVWAQTGFHEGPEPEEEASPTDQVASALLAHALAGGMPPEVAAVAHALFDHAMAAASPQSQDVDTLPMTQSLDSALLEDSREQEEEAEEAEYEDEHFEEDDPEEEEDGKASQHEITQEPQDPLPEEPTRSENYWPLLDMQLKPELQDKVDSFSRRLEEATSIFNHSTGDDGSYEMDEFLCSVSWNWSVSEPDNSSSYRTGRADLARAAIHDPLSQRRSSEIDDYEMVAKGCAARPPSPKRGKLRVPWYLESAEEVPTGLAAGQPAFPLERARSSSPRLVRHMKKTAKLQAANTRTTRRSIGKPPPKAKLEPRPLSAESYTRPRSHELVPLKPAPAAVEAAKSAKRFLSRTCGTMQAALSTFDPSGDGRFSREEWEDGLKQLDFTVNYDHQEIFTVLDKRQHHMLTLSDLLDYCSGIPIDTGMPAPGLRGTMSELFEEVMQEQLARAVQEALGDVAVDGLRHPSGSTSELPDVQSYVRRLQIERLKAQSTLTPAAKQRPEATQRTEESSSETEQQDPQEPGEEEQVVGKESSRGSQLERKEVRGKAAAKAGGRVQLSREESDRGTSKEGRKPVGKAKSGGPSPPSTPASRQNTREGLASRGTTPQERKEARLARAASTSSARTANSREGQGRTPSSWEAGSPARERLDFHLPQGPGTKKELTRSGSASSRKTGSPKRSATPNESVFASASGQDLVQRDPNISAREEIGKAKKKMKKKKVRRAGSEENQKRSRSPERSYLAVRNQPQPVAKFAGYSYVEREDYGRDVADAQLLPFVPRPASEICKTYGHIFRILGDPGVRRLKVQPPTKRSVHVFMPRASSSEPSHPSNSEDLAASKSSPDLRTTQASTTAGTWRSSNSERVSLPPVAQTQNQRPELPNLGAAAIDEECRRNPGSLRTEGSQGTL